MKQLVLFVCLVVGSLISSAQNDTTTAGKIVYYEGKVEIGNDPTWARAKINTPVKRNQSIRTTGDAVAEIVWTNGSKTIVGPNSKMEIKGLLSASAGNSKSATEGVFGDFMTVFKSDAGAKRSEEGGIRRDEATGKMREEIYWKADKEISFSQAFSLYENKEYAKAIPALQAFIDQKPHDEMTKYAEFALGHSYIMSNNSIKAKEIFSNFVLIHSTDSLKADAEKVLALL